MAKKVILTIITIICFGAIFFFSCQPAADSDAVSGGMALRLLERFTDYSSLSPEEQYVRLMSFDEVLRSTAHFGMALVAGLFLYLAASAFSWKKPALWTMIICFLYSVSDELHQELFSEGRSFQLEDIAKDWAGALVGIGLAATLIRICKISARHDGGRKDTE